MDSSADPTGDESDAELDAGERPQTSDDAATPDDADGLENAEPADRSVTPDAENDRDAGGDGGERLWAQVAIGTAHACAVIESGDVLCWGANASGQVGDGSRVNRPEPTQVPGIRAQSVAAGANKTCAVLLDGRVTCWGALAITLNLMESELPVDIAFAPTVVEGVERAVEVAVGTHQQCALLEHGTVACWRWERFTAELVAPTPIDGAVGATQLSASASDACAVLGDQGKFTCWTLPLNRSPAEDGSVERIGAGVRSAALGGFWCVLLRAGTVQCAGSNTWGQLGDGTVTQSQSPVSVLELSQVAHLSVGDQHACAVTEAGELYCWGNKIGFGDVAAKAVTMPMRILAPAVAGVAAGTSHTCIALENGDVMCWGANGFGQIGDGTSIFAPRPRQVVGLRSGTK